jgi:hypothetical protein
MAANGEQLRTFPIFIKDNGRVHDPDSRKSLRLNKGEQVQWVATTPGPWRIVFENSPFSQHNFVVDVGSPALSGQPRDDAALGSFKYRVFLDDAEEASDDPDILIES